MCLRLHFHPLSALCQKVLVALYENDTPFERHIIELANENSRAAFLKLWPVGKMPVLRDETADRTVPESSIIIEYLARHFPGRTELIPTDPDLARQARLYDRFYDLYVNEPMEKIVTDRRRPSGQNDVIGVEQARTHLRSAYGIIDHEMAKKTWAIGETFTMADCAAAPAMYFANLVMPFEGHRHAAAYLGRLMERPSFARTLREAEPYFSMIS